jgi:threonylcarbamoyladenosine tRNA methylthiotransferase MtaB
LTGGNNRAGSGVPPGGTVGFASFGCRTNQEEIETLKSELCSAGFRITDDLASADFLIVNTCSVTAHTEAKTRRFISGVARKYPRAKIVATGCLVEQTGEALHEGGRVAFVVGNARKHEIPHLISTTTGGVFLAAISRSALPLSETVSDPSGGGRTRFSVKIQEGCDHACTYCIVPRLRGPSRSVPAKRIAGLCRRAIDLRYKEIVLTGTHIGQYRDPDGDGTGLFPLIDRLLALEGDFRVRLSSLDPRELPDDLFARVGSGGRLCDHLHLSLQSLCGEVLAGMGRPYARLEELVDKLKEFRNRFPRAGLGADFIVGFPGESDEGFETTLRRVEMIGFSYGHIFRFSSRPGTKAATMPGKVPELVKQERSARLRAAIAASREKFVGDQAGSTGRIIVEQESPVAGITSNYLHVEIPGCRAPHNSWCDVVLDGTILNGGRACGAGLFDAGCALSQKSI